jgi:Tfp pilus assembly protein PilO
MRNIIALLLIIASVGIFYGYIKPEWATVGELKSQVTQYDTTLQQADDAIQKLVDDQAKIKSISASDLQRLNVLVPDSLNTINMIIDFSNISSNYGLSIKNIKIVPGANSSSKYHYNSAGLSFSVNSSYDNFKQFLNGIESSLHIIDVTSVSFTPDAKSNLYNFSVTLNTYWLK